MSKITLDNNYHIDIDGLNFQLVYRREKEITKKNKETDIEETKTVTEKNDWYFPSLAACLRTYFNESMRECNSIEHVLQRINEVEEIIKKIK